MKKFVFILVILLFICETVFAVTYVDTQKGALPKDTPVATISINPANLAVSDIGFTDKVPSNFESSILKSGSVKITHFVEATKTFKSDEFYIFWNILGGAASMPTIKLTINDALRAPNVTQGVNWKVSWMEGNTPCYINSTDKKTCQIYPPLNEQGKTGSGNNVLKRVTGYKALLIETIDEYWKAPIDKYDSQLWIEIVT